MSRLRPFFPYFGSKWRLAPKYPAPRFDLIIEPFAGSAQYATLYYDRDVLLIDADPTTVALWEFIIQADEEEILSLPEMRKGDRVSDQDLSEGQRLFLSRWANPAATGPCNTFTTYGDKQYKNARQRVSRQLRHIRHWKVCCADYRDIPNTPATWFVDPPYSVQGRNYKKSADLIDFQFLGDWCKKREGQIIVTENDGADWLPFEPFAETSGSKILNGKSVVSKEVVFCR